MMYLYTNTWTIMQKSSSVCGEEHELWLRQMKYVQSMPNDYIFTYTYTQLVMRITCANA